MTSRLQTGLITLAVCLFMLTTGTGQMAGQTVEPIDAHATNLLLNGSFEDGIYDDQLEHWQADAFSPGGTFLREFETVRDGYVSARIDAPDFNDQRWIQSVTVDKETNYLLYGWIKTDNVEQDPEGAVEAGATFSLLDFTDPWLHTDALLGDNEWQLRSLHFNAGDQSEVTVAARLGYFSGMASGTAWFDNVKLVAITEEHAFDLQFENWSIESHPGQTVTHRLWVINTGSMSDSYDIVTDAGYWPPDAPTSIGPLASGERASFAVTVQIPPAAHPGQFDFMDVTVSSHAQPAVTQEVELSTAVVTACADAYEPNDTPTQATTIGYGETIYGAKICPAGDEEYEDDIDYFIFSGVEGDRIGVDIDTPPTYMSQNLTLQLLSADGTTQLLESLDRDGGDPRFEYTLPATGEFYLKVTGDWGWDDTEFYSLQLTEIPHVAVESAPTPITVVVGTVATETLQISNRGNSTLTWSALGIAGANNPSSQGAVEEATESYTVRDSNDPDGPLYHWIEIATPEGGAGTRLDALNGFYSVEPSCEYTDPYVYPVWLPFTFDFYGQSYNQIAVGVSGVIYFEDSQLGSCRRPIPYDNSQGVEALIAPFWGQIDTPGNGGVYVQDLGSIYVIEYYNAFAAFSAGPGAWQVLLFENGDILFQYKDVYFGQNDWDNRDAGADQSIGIQANGNTGLEYSYRTESLENEFAICFAPTGEPADCAFDIPWLMVSPGGGNIEPGESMVATLHFNANAVDPAKLGVYEGTMVLQSNDPAQPTVLEPVSMNVVDVRYDVEITVDVGGGNTGAPGAAITYPISVTNRGNVDDSFTATLSGNSWPAQATPTLTPVLLPAATTVISVTTTIPLDAQLGATDAVTVTVRSQGDNEQYAAVALETAMDRANVYLPWAER